MKKLVLLVASLAAAGAANAALINCPSPPPPAVNVTLNNYMLTCSGLTFMNFMTADAAGNGGGPLSLVSASYDPQSGDVFLNFNPNLGSHQDMYVYFTVKGGINAIDLSVGPGGGTIIEEACANPIPTTGPLKNLCTNAAQTQSAAPLGTMTVNSSTPNQPIVTNLVGNPSFTSPVYIFKDVMTPVEGGMSSFNQSFHGQVPEPVSILLMGSGLLALGLLRRRRA